MVHFDFMLTWILSYYTCMFTDVDCDHLFTVLHQTFSSFLPFQTWPPHFSSSHWPPLSFPTKIHTNASQNWVKITVWVTMNSFISAQMDAMDPQLTFSVSSFLTDLRFALRSMDTLCLEPSRERRMASAETRTLLRGGLLNFPLRSRTLMFRSLICNRFVYMFHNTQGSIEQVPEWVWMFCSYVTLHS